MKQDRPFSEACERNRDPILAVLRQAFAATRMVLEIGSGTGQHAVHFARHLPHLIWQPTDMAGRLPGIRIWTDEAALINLCDPVALDIDEPDWPVQGVDAVFTANTLHIVAWPTVEHLFERAGALLPFGGDLAIYGPFRRGGRHTADSNAAFDARLRESDPASGIRDLEAVDALAVRHGFGLQQLHDLPANNALVIWKRD